MDNIVEMPKEIIQRKEAQNEMRKFIFEMAVQRFAENVIKELKCQYIRGMIDGLIVAILSFGFSLILWSIS